MHISNALGGDIDLSAQVNIAADPERLYHSPALIEVPNGDWLCAFQDSRGKNRVEDHTTVNGVVS